MNTPVLSTISIVYNSALLIFSGWWIFYTVRTPYDRCCSALFLPLLILTFISISRSKSEEKHASLPLKINLTALALIILIIIFRSYWDLDFILHGKEYSSVAQSVNVNDYTFSEDEGFHFNLPGEFAFLNDETYVIQDQGNSSILIIFPITPSDLDGLLTAYIYNSTSTTMDLPEKCLSGRTVRPYYQHWFYCVIGQDKIK